MNKRIRGLKIKCTFCHKLAIGDYYTKGEQITYCLKHKLKFKMKKYKVHV